MKTPHELERIRLPQKDKESLIRLKARTGIENWNTLCRWAFLLSLTEPKAPKAQEIIADSNVEMGWKTFAGEHDQLMLHLLVERCLQDSLSTDPQTLGRQFRLHLHRGIAYLATKGKITSIADLVQCGIAHHHAQPHQTAHEEETAMTSPRGNTPTDYVRIKQLVHASGLFAGTPPQINRVRYHESAPDGRVEADYVIPIHEDTPELLDDFQEKLRAFIAGQRCADDIATESDRRENGKWVRDIRVKFTWHSSRLSEQSPVPDEDKPVDHARIEQLAHDSGLLADSPLQIRRFRFYESAPTGQVKADYEIRVCACTPELLDDSQEKLRTFIAGKRRVDEIAAESDQQADGQWVRDLHFKFSWHSDGLTRQSSEAVDYERARKLVHDSGLGNSLHTYADRPPFTRIYYRVAGNRATAFFQITVSGDSQASLDELQERLRAHVTSRIGAQRLEAPFDMSSDGLWVRIIWIVFEWPDNSLSDCPE